MRIIPDQLRSKNLVPFKKRHGRYKIPGMTTENQVLMDRVDPDLSAEEQSYVRHYLGYADALIRSAEENASSEAGEARFEESAGESEELAEDEQARPAESASILMDEPIPGEDDPAMRAA
jgi:hypothetical protein